MSTLFRDVVYPAYHWAKRDGLNDAVHRLEENQWLKSNVLQSIQREKLEELLAHASRHVPYYRTLFEKLKISSGKLVESCEIARIPPLTKKIIRENQTTVVSEYLQGNRLFANSTSGSTGEALYFYTDQRSTTFRKAAEIRGRTWAGWRIGDGIVSLWGSPIDQKKGTSLRGKLHGWITRHKFLSSYNLSVDAMTQYSDEILNFAPALLVSYPGPLERFAEYCSESSLRFPSLRGIITSAENLWPHQRKTIEAAFGLPVLDRYGCREFGLVAQECNAHSGLHVNTDRVYVEIVDENDQPCSPGVSGRMLVTDLDNFGSPIIRYEVGDEAAWADRAPCDCGREFPRLKTIEGRTLDVVRTSAGDRIGGTFWTLLFRSMGGIKQFQVVQEQMEGVQINFVRDDSFDKSCLVYFGAQIRDRCGDDFAIRFNEVSDIDLTQAGKRRLVISNC